jgi:hypothetical protein
MIAFEIAIDGRTMCTAGVGDEGVMSVIATWVRRPARDPETGEPLPGRFAEELTLDAGGLTHDLDGAAVQVRWLRQSLRVGQRITLTIVEAAEADPPRTRDRTDPTEAERQKRRYYERLKRELGDA